jgi:hypothetical protein
MKTGFFQALIGSCCGTAIFERLRNQHLGRTVFHLILMSLLCSVFMEVGIYKDWKKKSRATVNTIVENCGSIKIDKKGFTPEKSPQKLKNFIAAGPFAVTYLPEGSSLPGDFQQGCNIGLLWKGNKLLLWQKNNNGYLLTPIDNSQSDNDSINAAAVEEIEQTLNALHGVNIQGELNLTPGVLNVLSNMMLVTVLIMLAVFNLFQVVFYIAIFTGIFALMNMGRPRRFTVKEMIKLSVYAGFPAMLIGSAAAFLELPLLDFNLTYVLGMTFYLMFVMNRLDRDRQQREWQDKEQQ